MAQKICALLIILCLFLEQPGIASPPGFCRAPRYLAGAVSAESYRPVHIRSISLDRNSCVPQILLDKGSEIESLPETLEEVAGKLISYFAAGLFLPDDVFWVNLRPESPDRIIDPLLEDSDIGRIMLEADVFLKQDLARLTSPDTKEGKEYWDKVYAKAEFLFGCSEDIVIPTATRPWIVPGEIILKKSVSGVYIYKALMNVCLEDDRISGLNVGLAGSDPRVKEINEYSTDLIRRIVLPKLTREVNSSKRYSGLRQVFYSLVLSQWFKRNLGQKDFLNLLGAVRGGSVFSTCGGWSKETYYRLYKQSFEKGEYDRQEAVGGRGVITVRRYFSGGLSLFNSDALSHGSQLIIEGQDLPIGHDTILAPGIERFSIAGRPAMDGGKIGYVYEKDPLKRRFQAESILAEIRKELAEPGSGRLPWIAVISDIHGDADRFAQLLSDFLARTAGFSGELDPGKPIGVQLARQSVDLSVMNAALYIDGDILDRGPNGLKCFLMCRELKRLAPDKIFFTDGNHDEMAKNNLKGAHLPWYKGYDFKGDKEAEKLIEQRRASNPEYFDSFEAFLTWTGWLAEFNEEQEKFQKEFLGGRAGEIRRRFIEAYDEYGGVWNSSQLDAMEDFAGYFGRIKVTDPYIGLNGMGKTSVGWWQSLYLRLTDSARQRSYEGADEAEAAVWREAVALSWIIYEEVQQRAYRARTRGMWWYRIMESINNHAYRSAQWAYKDWSSHKGWGESLIAEVNAMIDAGLLDEEKISQKDYPKSRILRELAQFLEDNCVLYLRDPYGNLITHSWLPVNDDANIVINYRGVEYGNAGVFEGLDRISDDIKDPRLSLDKKFPALELVNSWYADKTSSVKVNNVIHYVENVGVARIQEKLGVNYWFTGHNPMPTLGLPFMTRDGLYAHFEIDKGMAEKFGGQGGYALIGPGGIMLRGFSSRSDDSVVDNPLTVRVGSARGRLVDIENGGLAAKEFLSVVYDRLMSSVDIESEILPDDNRVEEAITRIQESGKFDALLDYAGIAVVAAAGTEALNWMGSGNFQGYFLAAAGIIAGSLFTSAGAFHLAGWDRPRAEHKMLMNELELSLDAGRIGRIAEFYADRGSLEALGILLRRLNHEQDPAVAAEIMDSAAKFRCFYDRVSSALVSRVLHDKRHAVRMKALDLIEAGSLLSPEDYKKLERYVRKIGHVSATSARNRVFTREYIEMLRNEQDEIEYALTRAHVDFERFVPTAQLVMSAGFFAAAGVYSAVKVMAFDQYDALYTAVLATISLKFFLQAKVIQYRYEKGRGGAADGIMEDGTRKKDGGVGGIDFRDAVSGARFLPARPVSGAIAFTGGRKGGSYRKRLESFICSILRMEEDAAIRTSPGMLELLAGI